VQYDEGTIIEMSMSGHDTLIWEGKTCSSIHKVSDSFFIHELVTSSTDCIISQLADSQRCQLRKEAEKLADS
jgi:hypothetical protein